MNKYQEAYNDIKENTIQSTVNNKKNYMTSGVISVESLEAIKELVDKEIEQESRKDKLVIGSEWVCVADCYSENWAWKKGTKVLVTRISNIYGNYVDIYDGSFEDNMPEEQFLLCFMSKEETK